MPHRSIPRPQISPLHVALLLFSVLSSSANAGTNMTSDRYGLYSNFDPSMAIVVMVLISVFFFVGFFTIFLRHCSEQPSLIAPSGDMPRKQGLDPEVIASFPVFLYSEVKEIKIGRETLECAVCLSEFEDDESLRLLPKCNHVFHPHCIDAWLISHVTCPVCRAKLNSTPPPSRQTPRSPLHQSPNSPPQNDIVITVEDEPRRGISGKFPRSHSTGHSLVQLEWNTERFTLRLPEELRRQIMVSAKLKRTRSFDVVLPGEGSSRKGYRNGGGGEGSSRGKYFFGWSDRWAVLRNPPFGYRGGSVKPNKGAEDGDSVNGRTLLSTVKAPLNCLSFEGSGSG